MPCQLSEADCARIQPLVDKFCRVCNAFVRKAIAISETREGALEIMQGGFEYLGEMLREQILEQVDRGEWSASGFTRRDQLDVTITVDAQRALENQNTNILEISIQPTERLS